MKDAGRWERVKQVFQAALDRPMEERSGYLRVECGSDDDLRAEVNSLLDAHQRAGSFAEGPAVPDVGAWADDGPIEHILQPGDQLGPYEITGWLGSGGMGEVYRAYDTKLKREVAVKILPPSLADDPNRLARFQREAEVLASLNHPNIGAIHGLEESGGVTALVMELVEGEDLSQRIARGPIPIDDALPIAKQIAEALEAAHEQGIIHRDLKPANIKVRPDGAVKVLDFGLAKAMDPVGRAPNVSQSPTITTPAMTQAGMILGTAAYMSPDQARGRAVDERTDIWAFGCVLYEMLTGRRVFDGTSTSEVMAKVLEREPDFGALPAMTPPSIRRLLQRCLEKDPKDRLRDIGDARFEMKEASAKERREVAEAVPTRHWYLRPAAIAVAIVVIAIVGGMLVISLVRPLADSGSRQFVILPPEGNVFGVGVLDRIPPLAISPDGLRLAFVATDASGRRLLWVRPLSSLNAEPLDGTEGASEPFWSPDGASVAFFAGGKLKRVAMAGGAPVTLADAPNGSGGTWSRDGVIVYAPSPQSGLLRISDTGGMPIVVTSLTAGDYGHVHPQFLPDGHHFIYLVRAAPARKGIYVSSIDSLDSTRILEAREKARYALPGYLLFLRDGRLMTQAFDANRHELSGDAVPVADSVGFIATDGRASYDVSNTGALVYRASGLLAASQPVWVDGSGKTIANVGEPGDYQTASLSPDGSQMAVEKHDLRTSTGDLWLIDLKRGPTSRFTFDGMHNNRAIWSPDGGRIVFTGRPDGIRNLHIKGVGSESDEPLLTPGPDRIPTDWSQDGRHILFDEGPQGREDMWTLQMPERMPVPFLRSEFAERGGRFSPNGRWVAYVSNETGRDEVYVRSFREGTGRRQVSVNGGWAPRWSRDGRELFFVGPNNSVLTMPVNTGDRFETGVPRVLFTTDMRRGAPGADAWFSVDGQRFFVVPNPPGPLPPALPITVVLDWTSVLTRDMP